jgi:hypothetical protein
MPACCHAIILALIWLPLGMRGVLLPVDDLTSTTSRLERRLQPGLAAPQMANVRRAESSSVALSSFAY